MSGLQSMLKTSSGPPSSWWSIATPDAGFFPSGGGFTGGWMAPYSDDNPPDPARMKLLVALGTVGVSKAFNSSDGVRWDPVSAPWPDRKYAATSIVGEMPGSAVGFFSGQGSQRFGPMLDDFWVWRGGAWTQRPKPPPPEPWPPGRTGGCLVNPQDGNLWLFAGDDLHGLYFRDLWRSQDDGAQWEQVSNAVRFEPRSHACAFGFRAGGGFRIWLGAGEISGNVMQKPWLFDGASWTPLPAPEWPARARANIALMGSIVFLFGGIGPGGAPLTDLWATQLDDLEHWTLLDPNIPPGSTSDSSCAVANGSLFVTEGPLADAVWRMTPPMG